MFKLNEIAVKIKHTNPPDKETKCLDKVVSSIERERTNLQLLAQDNVLSNTLISKDNGCAKAQLRKTGTQSFAIVAKTLSCVEETFHSLNQPCSLTYKPNFIYLKPACRAAYSFGGGVISSIGKCFAQVVDEWEIKTSSAKVRLIQLFDAETICSADLKNARHLQPQVGDPADTYSNKLWGKYNHQLIVIHTCHSPLLRERVRVRGQSKTSFPLQIGKEVRGKYNQLVVSTPSLEVRCKK